MLSDAVWFAQQEYQPDILIDVATLTGSVSRAVGETYAGLFSNNEALADRLLAAGRRAGASMGAAFIGTFIREGQVWAHLDIAGVDYAEEPLSTVPRGYSAYGVRMLDEYIRDARE